jgi:hypothetical protein
MARVLVDWVGVVEGPAFMEATEEGPMPTWNVQVGCEVGGKQYVLAGFVRRPARRLEAERLVGRIDADGTVDLSLWDEVPPRPSLEERFAIYAQNEDEVRHGFRPEADLYHGV